MSAEFNPNECPLGVKHEADLKHLEEKLEMSVQRLDEKLDDIKQDLSTGFAETNKAIQEIARRYDELNTRFIRAENSIDERIDKRCDARIEAHKKELIWKGWKKVLAWAGGILGSSACITWILKTILELIEKG